MSYTDKSLATEGEFALPCAAFLHHEQFVVAGSGWYAPTRVPSRAVSKMPLVVDKRLPQLCHIGEKDNLWTPCHYDAKLGHIVQIMI